MNFSEHGVAGGTLLDTTEHYITEHYITEHCILLNTTLLNTVYY